MRFWKRDRSLERVRAEDWRVELATNPGLVREGEVIRVRTNGGRTERHLVTSVREDGYGNVAGFTLEQVE